MSKKSYIIVKYWLSGDSPQCGEMSRSDKGEGHVLSAPAPTIRLFFVGLCRGEFRSPAYPEIHKLFETLKGTFQAPFLHSKIKSDQLSIQHYALIKERYLCLMYNVKTLDICLKKRYNKGVVFICIILLWQYMQLCFTSFFGR